LLVRLTLSRGGVRNVEVFPTHQQRNGCGTRVEALAGEPAERFATRWRRLNEIASDPALVRKFWDCFCEDRRPEYAGRLLAGAGVAGAGLRGLMIRAVLNRAPHFFVQALAEVTARYVNRRSIQRKELARLLNVLQCPAHHEVVTTVVEMQLEGRTPAPAVRAEFRELIRDCRMAKR